MKKFLVIILILTAFTFAFADEGAEQNQIILEQPVLITSGGQSPGALQMQVLAKMVKLNFVFEKLLGLDDFLPQDYNSVIIVVGASGKGLGAAGIDIDAEVARLKGLCVKAKENSISVVLVQLEGSSRRGPTTDLIVNELSEFANLFIVKENADEDGLFTDLSKEFEIPLEFFDKTSDIKAILLKLYQL